MPRPWRIPVVYAVAIPLALVLGFLVSSPDPFTFALLGMILLFLALPLVLKWHHVFLIVSWNAGFNFFFLPGQPDMWLVLAVVSWAISLLNHFMFQKEFLRAPQLTRPLLLLALVVVGTACYRGGIGIRALGGSTYGGKYYFYSLGAIVGYFALTAEPIPISKSGKMAALFFLPGLTFVLSNLAYTLGPAFYILYYLVPAGLANGQVASDFGVTSIDRIVGLSSACPPVFCFLLARYGIRGLFDWTKPWRLFFFCVTVGASFFAGFRSILALLFLIFAFQFYFEGLLRSRLFPAMIWLALFCIVPVLLLSDKMPPVVQRTLSFLPVNVDAEVRADARGSSEWRFQMWAVVWKDVPKYLLIGKGYSIDPTDLFLTTEGIRDGILSSIEEPMLAGDYHSGPLSVLIPFGLMGMAAFLWVLGAGGWVLYSNFRYGPARLHGINNTLLSYYLAYAVAFFFLFGAFNSQLFIFLGTVGFSVSLNGGVKKAPAANGKPVALPELVALEPEDARPVA